MVKSDKKAKSDKIKIIRQQYDAFMDEDKKRKERNEYILNRLDKMRCCDYIVPYRPKVHIMNENYNTQSYRRYAHNSEPAKENRISRSQMSLIPVDLLPKTIEESVLLKEISKKYILIPKLKNADDSNEFSPTKTDVKSSFEDNDWKSKYEILNKLKQEEKENITTPAHDKGQLNETIDLHCSTNDKSYYKYDVPVRDDNSKIKIEREKLNEKQTDLRHEDVVNSTAEVILAVHRKSVGFNKDSSRAEIVEFTSEKSESITNDTNILQGLANSIIAQEQQRLNKPAEIGDNITVPQINTEAHDASNVVAEEQHHPEKDKVYETHTMDCKVTNNEGECNVKEDYQYVAAPNIFPEETASTDAVQLEEQDQVYTQGYDQQVPNEYNEANFPEGENAVYTDENYAHEDHNQQYYNDPSVAQERYQEQEYQVQENQELEYHGQEHQGQEYQGQEYQGQGYQGQEYQGQEYQGQVYQDQNYQGQYVDGAPEYNNQPQYSQNAIINATNDNTNEPHHMLPEPIDENQTYYSETSTVQDNAATGVVLQNEYDADVINPTENPDYVEGIQEFESEANLYNNVDPNVNIVDPVAAAVVLDENNLQQPISQEDYNVFYEDNQVAQDLDLNDKDATLQQYDQSYEAQYTGNYEEEVPIVENIQVAYEPVQTQEVEYEQESLANIEQTLDSEQGYMNEGDIQNTDTNIEQAEQPIEQSAILQQVPAALKKEMIKKN